MSDSQEIILSNEWNANDYSNIITISSAAIASVLLVIFKSRCSNISLCCGLFACDRKVLDKEEEEEADKAKKKNKKKPIKPLALVLSEEEQEPEPEPEINP